MSKGAHPLRRRNRRAWNARPGFAWRLLRGRGGLFVRRGSELPRQERGPEVEVGAPRGERRRRGSGLGGACAPPLHLRHATAPQLRPHSFSETRIARKSAAAGARFPRARRGQSTLEPLVPLGSSRSGWRRRPAPGPAAAAGSAPRFRAPGAPAPERASSPGKSLRPGCGRPGSSPDGWRDADPAGIPPPRAAARARCVPNPVRQA
jgi:hypothetical protein